MLKHLVITLFLMCFAAPALADDTSRANELLVEAVQLLQSAEGTAGAMERFRLSEEALGNLNEIVDRYPTTDLAVKLITGQAIGNISLESVAEAVEEVRWPACLGSPNYDCIISLAFAVAAEETIESHCGVSSSGAPLAHVASAQVKAGDVEGAKETITQALAAVRESQSTPLSYRQRIGCYFVNITLHHIASAQAEAGDVGAALVTAEAIEEFRWRAWAIHRIASAQAEAGDAVGALATAEKIEDTLLEDHDGMLPMWRIWVRSNIASAQAEAGDVVGAKETIAQTREGIIFSPPRRLLNDFVLFNIASAEAKAGEMASALANLEKMEDTSFRAWAFADVASTQARAGVVEGARKSITQALATIETKKSPSSNAFDIWFDCRILANVASAQAEVGDIKGAKESIAEALVAAEKLEDAYWRAWAFNDIASAQADAGDMEGTKETVVQALATAKTIKNADDRAETLAEIAQALTTGRTSLPSRILFG